MHIYENVLQDSSLKEKKI